MDKYYYTELKVPQCEEILYSYYKKTLYLLPVIKLKLKKDYIFLRCAPTDIRLFMKHNPVTYKLRMTEDKNITNMELNIFNTKWYIITLVINGIVVATVELLLSFLITFYLYHKMYIQTFYMLLFCIIPIFITLVTLSEKRKYKNQANTDVDNFLRRYLRAQEKK